MDLKLANSYDARSAIPMASQELDGPSVLETIILPPAVISARINPFFEIFKAEVISVPSGYGFNFRSTSVNGWTDNTSSGEKPLEGFDFPDESEYRLKARRAQLIGVDFDQDEWFGYAFEVDSSKGGTKGYNNTDNRTWKIWWIMNDRDNGYGDNGGTATVTFAIYKL